MPNIDLNVVVEVYEGPLLRYEQGSSRKSYQMVIGFHEQSQMWVTWAQWGKIGAKPRCTLYLAHVSAAHIVEEASARHFAKQNRGYQGDNFPDYYSVLKVRLGKSGFPLMTDSPKWEDRTHHTQGRDPDEVPL